MLVCLSYGKKNPCLCSIQKQGLPGTGIEPARRFSLPRDFKSLVSTYSTIPADKNTITEIPVFFKRIDEYGRLEWSRQVERPANWRL